MASFLLVEIDNADINALFAEMKEILTGSRPGHPVHLTLRGPYQGPISAAVLSRWRDALAYDVLRIEGVGRFSNPSEEVVYLRVDSPGLREVWWKPDYPIQRFGFEPHVSLYRGGNKLFADRVASFLEGERIRLLCAEFSVVRHTQGQRQRRLLRPATSAGEAVRRLSEAGWISPTLLDGLRRIAAVETDDRLAGRGR